jgi:hypothetical protein
VAATDSLPVDVVVANHGELPVTLLDVSITGAAHHDLGATVVPPDSSFHETWNASHFGSARPWWIGQRKEEAYPRVLASLDGLDRGDDLSTLGNVRAVTVPEDIRRTTDVNVTLSIAGVAVNMSAGPITSRLASASLGVQERPVATVPAIALAFERSLEWVPGGRPIDRRIRLSIRSLTDSAVTFSLTAPLLPEGVRVDSMPRTITMAPREERDVFLRVRGRLAPGRYPFGVVGETARGAHRYAEGFRTIELTHVPPVRVFRSSGVYLQVVNVEAPPDLTIAYVQGVGDEGDVALRQIGIPIRALTPEELAFADLSRFTTVVLGPRALDAHPELAGQLPRLHEFARRGGALVILNGQAAEGATSVLPFPVSLAAPNPEHVTSLDAPVTELVPRSRVLDWPNRITNADWAGWVRERALYVPTTVDARYAQVVEMHDAEQPPNRNSILVAPLGRGTIIYSTITFFAQLPGGVPGSLRLLVNLVSAGCGSASRPGRCGPARPTGR